MIKNKKGSVAIIVVIICACVAVVGGIITLILINSGSDKDSGNSNSSNSSTSSSNTSNSNSDDEKRKQDLMRIRDKLKQALVEDENASYLSNNKIIKYINQYIMTDTDESLVDLAIDRDGDGENKYDCVSDLFCDPDGYTYIPVFVNRQTMPSADRRNKVNHVVYISVTDLCGEGKNLLKSGTDYSDFALFYVLGDKTTYCVDSSN